MRRRSSDHQQTTMPTSGSVTTTKRTVACAGAAGSLPPQGRSRTQPRSSGHPRRPEGRKNSQLRDGFQFSGNSFIHGQNFSKGNAHRCHLPGHVGSPQAQRLRIPAAPRSTRAPFDALCGPHIPRRLDLTRASSGRSASGMMWSTCVDRAPQPITQQIGSSCRTWARSLRQGPPSTRSWFDRQDSQRDRGRPVVPFLAAENDRPQRVHTAISVPPVARGEILFPVALERSQHA